MNTSTLIWHDGSTINSCQNNVTVIFYRTDWVPNEVYLDLGQTYKNADGSISILDDEQYAFALDGLLCWAEV